MANEAQTIEERLLVLEAKIRELEAERSVFQAAGQAEANIEFWKLQNLEAKVDALINGQNDFVVDSESMDGTDPIMNGTQDDNIMPWPKPLEITRLTVANKKASIKNNAALAGGLWIAGVQITSISDGTGMTWVGADDEWISDAITDTSWIYLLVDKTNATATINMATTIPDGTSSVESVPLWKIGWDSTNATLDINNIVDLRNAIHVMGFA